MQQEKVIETKKCKHCSNSFDITNKDLEFYNKVSPSFPSPDSKESDLKKIQIPPPTLCPECREQRRMVWRNERKLYKRKCDLTGIDIISIYSPEKPYKVYEQIEWWSDKWNALKYGKEFDFNKRFFEQFNELLLEVPRISLSNSSQINSEYCNHTTGMKDSYLVFGSADSENCLFSTRVEKSNYIIDSIFINKSSYIYECVDIKNSYNVHFSQKCTTCTDSKYLFDCHNCKNCFGCINLNNKQYYIFNKEYSKNDYFIKINELGINYSYEIFKNYITKNAIMKFANIQENENVFGDDIFNSKNIYNSFGIYDSEDIKYSQDLYNHSINSLDCYSGYGPIENCYECYSFGVGAYNNLFITDCYPISESMYCDNCYSCSNIFGCVGLTNAKYCICNKQYTKEEYKKLVPKIIEHMIKTGEWGEFFPSSISPFGYNETVANEYFPLLKEEAIKKGFKWSTYEPTFPKVDKIIPANKLPDNIKDIPDDILNRAIECEITKKPFKIIHQELDFYRKHNLPIPKRHPDQRHLDRMKLRNSRKLFDRKCDKCGINMKTSYSPLREEIVYCESCYEKEIY